MGWIASHVGVAALIALAALAWYGWHRPVLNQVSSKIIQVPVGQTLPIVVEVPASSIQIPAQVTAPSPQIRVITVPQTVILPPQTIEKSVTEASQSVKIHINRICVHPDNGAPDPTCGPPWAPDITAVSTGGVFVVEQTKQESAQTQIGPVVTQVQVPRPQSPWTYRIGVGVDNMAGVRTVVAGQVQYTRGPFFVQGTMTYPVSGAVGGPGFFLIGGFQF